jgi:murein DD-endopeptidase MepM/ murein hydrolase activator NlpD
VRRRFFLGLPLALYGQDLQLAVPIAGLSMKDLRDTFDERRGGGRHEAIDILAPRGTPILAVVRGTIRKLFLSKPGGITIYLFDEREEYCYYYGHLDRYREGLREGMKVSPGDELAYVGSTGNADPRAPHLHMAIFELGPEKRWWKGTAINPYPHLVAAVKAAPPLPQPAD